MTNCWYYTYAVYKFAMIILLKSIFKKIEFQKKKQQLFQKTKAFSHLKYQIFVVKWLLLWRILLCRWVIMLHRFITMHKCNWWFNILRYLCQLYTMTNHQFRSRHYVTLRINLLFSILLIFKVPSCWLWNRWFFIEYEYYSI